MTDIQLVIPTCRLRDVSQTVTDYCDNLGLYGHHDVPVVVFDDSSLEVHKRDFPALEARKLENKGGILYVGPQEKARFIDELVQEVGSDKEGIIRRLTRPSYGGNRNFTLLYTLGDLFISADDDMRPHGLFHKDELRLRKDEILKGMYVDKTNKQLYERRDFDLVSAILEVLGKTVEEGVGGLLKGSTLIDSMTDLYTNKTVGFLKSNTVTLVEGNLGAKARVITAQTFRSGSADVDAIDYANDFLINPHNAFVNDMSLRYVLQAFRPCLTKTNWRLDTGVSSYDNSKGLPPFFPTALRFEDYGFRIWLQSPEVVAAHVNAVQTHYKNPYMRESLAHDLWNEEIANFLKPRLKEMAEQFTPIGVLFEGDISVSAEEARVIMERGRECFEKAIGRAAEVMQRRECVEPLTPEQNSNYLIGLARDLYDEFSGFDTRAFHERMQSVVNGEVGLIKHTTEIWPALLEATSRIKTRGQLPVRKVN